MISRTIGVGLLAALLTTAAACSEDSNDNPTPSLTGGAGGTSGSSGTGGDSGAGGASGSAGNAGVDGSVGTGGSAGADAGGTGGSAGIYDGGPDGEACQQQPSGCWPCPEGTDQFHNRCTTSACSKFDNAAKIRDWNGGNLRPLPGS